MAGIYIHIPFCKQACHYCNFHFSTSLKLQNAFTAALLKEIALRSEYIEGQVVDTIYFGGGTPSLLPLEQLRQIITALRDTFLIHENAEITFEANPDDINSTSLKFWKDCGINRLSIGVQSFFEEDLEWMNRAHTAQQAIRCISDAQLAGFDNLSIDLIYGGPTLPDSRWLENLSRAVDAGIPHLSCYALTVEPGTALHSMTSKKKVRNIETDDQARQFLFMSDYLRSRGYDHYEISNLALPGRRSRHNSSYWQGESYLGLGPSAHSFNGRSRQWNVSNNALYIQGLDKGIVPSELETLTPVQRLNEYIMTSIRTMEGTDLTYIERVFGAQAAERVVSVSLKFENRGMLQHTGTRLVLTPAGKLFADGIAAELFLDEDQTSTDSIFLNASRG